MPAKSTIANITGNVGMAASGYDDSWILSVDGKMVYGIGFCDSAGHEFGNTSVTTSSTNAAVGWSFTPPAAP